MSGNGVRPVVRARGLARRYGRVIAIDRADLDLTPGEILAVIGDDGAGKSARVKALCGAVQVDAGAIEIDGVETRFASPIEAREAAIETVCQNRALRPALSRADDMFLGRELCKPGFLGERLRRLDTRRMRAVARDTLAALGLMTAPRVDRAVETLSSGQRHAVAMARAAASATTVIIMDEPTAALGLEESRRMPGLIEDAQARARPIILISRDMPHGFELADRIRIRRLGRRAGAIRPQDCGMSDAVAIMTGAMPPPASELAA